MVLSSAVLAGSFWFSWQLSNFNCELGPESTGFLEHGLSALPEQLQWE